MGGVEVIDTVHSFYGDGTAAQFEAGQQTRQYTLLCWMWSSQFVQCLVEVDG